MISNKILTPMITEALEELSQQGISDLCPALTRLFNELMKIEREQVLGAAPYERTDARQGYANGFKNKTLHTRMGDLELEVPKARNIPFYPSCLEKGERTEKALKLALAEMYVNGVSTRRVKKITEELCGMNVSSTQVSRMSKIMDEELDKFRNRPLGKMRFVYFDAHYEKVRHEGCVVNLATLKAVGINEEGYREILGISCSLSEAEVHWRHFIESLQKRGLRGVELVISDDHSGLKAALRAVLPSVKWQRCLFHLAQNAQHYAPTHALKPEVAQAIRDIYQALSQEEAERRMRDVIASFANRASKFCDWLEENFAEGLTFYNFPRECWRRIRTVNVVERLNQEIRRRTRTVRLFPNTESCERLVTAVAQDIHEDWMSGKKYMVFEGK